MAIRDIAEVMSRHLGVPLASVAPDDAAEHFTWLAHFLSLDSPASSQRTAELLGWQPTQQGLLADLDEGHYFAMPRRVAAGRAVRHGRICLDQRRSAPGVVSATGPSDTASMSGPERRAQCDLVVFVEFPPAIERIAVVIPT